MCMVSPHTGLALGREGLTHLARPAHFMRFYQPHSRKANIIVRWIFCDYTTTRRNPAYERLYTRNVYLQGR